MWGQCSVRFQHQCDGLLQVGAGFFQRCSLGVGTRQLLNEPDVPFRDAPKNCGELKIHTPMIRLAANLPRGCQKDPPGQNQPEWGTRFQTEWAPTI